MLGPALEKNKRVPVDWVLLSYDTMSCRFLPTFQRNISLAYKVEIPYIICKNLILWVATSGFVTTFPVSMNSAFHMLNMRKQG
jgi:hypothetical protein